MKGLLNNFLKNVHIINSVFSTNLKHGPIAATIKKIASKIADLEKISTPFNQ